MRFVRLSFQGQEIAATTRESKPLHFNWLAGRGNQAGCRDGPQKGTTKDRSQFPPVPKGERIGEQQTKNGAFSPDLPRLLKLLPCRPLTVSILSPKVHRPVGRGTVDDSRCSWP